MTQAMDELDRAIAWMDECRSIHAQWADWQESDPNWRKLIRPEDPGTPEHHRDCEERYADVSETMKALRSFVQRIEAARGEHTREQTLQAVGELRGMAANLRRGKNNLTAPQLDHVLDLALACSE